MGLQAEQIADIITVVADADKKNAFTLLTTSLQKYPAMRQLFKGKGRSERGGEQLSFQVLVGTNNAAQTTSLHAEIDVTIADHFKTGRVPWRHVTTFFAFDEREPELNSQPEDLEDIVRGRRTDALADLAKKFEPWFWDAPTGSEASDDAPPWGVKYWNVAVNTTPDGAFQGGNPSGFSGGCAGLSSTTYPNYQNWSAKFASVDEDDFVERLKLAAYKTNFKNPVAVPGSTESQYGYYCPYTVHNQLGNVARRRNDNIGWDILHQNPMFGGTMIEPVPHLDLDTEEPFYGIDWSVFKPVFQRNEWMHESTQIRPGKQHREVIRWYDSSLNIECKDRRSLFVISKAT